jgi:NAD(P)H-hydrate repair Nnr-like enzyme with NAD(P)H-hydrate epimerase domain
MMGNEYDWYSGTNVEVATDGLREAARNWHDLAGRMTAVASLGSQQTLEASAFTIIIDGPVGAATAGDLHDAYQKEFDKLNGLFREAIVQFTAMGDALKENADWYEDVDAEAAQSFDGIATGHWPR